MESRDPTIQCSRQELVEDPNVDVVYVGTIHTLHLPHATMALKAGKHVVCEKPLAVNAVEAQEIVDLARCGWPSDDLHGFYPLDPFGND